MRFLGLAVGRIWAPSWCRGAAIGLLLFAGSTRAAEPPLVARIDDALQRAGSYLVRHQSPDGAWRSEQYGFFRDGLALTPLAANALFYLGQTGPEAEASWRKGADFLIKASASAARGDYPVYTSAMASWCVVLGGKGPEAVRAQQRWLASVKTLRFAPELGWKPADDAFGGWGYVVRPPQRPAQGKGPFTANMSATLYALGALRSAGTAPDDSIFAEALVFLERCQHPRDGGFCFSPDDEAGNKAGLESVEEGGRMRFRSYGSATADGVRALLLCGYGPDHPRVVAARDWLVRHFRAGFHPGDFLRDREVLREAHDYYYAWTVSHALHVLRVSEAGEPPVPWAEAMATSLLERQQADGSWRNAYTDGREDDPLVATPFAAAALALCRRSLVFPLEWPQPPAHGLDPVAPPGGAGSVPPG